MSDETRNKLISALRQFRHNNDNTGSITRPEQGFVFAYDRDETEGLVASLEKKLEQAEARCAELEEFAAFSQLTAERELDPDYVPPRTAAAMLELLQRSREITKEDESCDYESAWLLRKQADEIDIACNKLRRDGIRPESSRPTIAVADLHDYANSLRQQASDIESGGDDG